MMMEEENNTEQSESESEGTSPDQEAPATEQTSEAVDQSEADANAASEEIPAEKTKTGAVIRMNGGALQTELNGEEIFKKWPDFHVGDNVKVHYRIVEGDKQRIQIYEGTVISIRGEGLGKSFIVRRVSHEVGVERIFPYHSPSIANLEISRRGKVRRGKLFYLRHKSGKEGRIKESMKYFVAAQSDKKGSKGGKKKKKKEAKASAE